MIDDDLYCCICEQIKPPRSHHCSYCNICVLRMDHHCPWMGNCIGKGNYASFIHSLLYSILLLLFHLFCTGLYYCKWKGGGDYEFYDTLPYQIIRISNFLGSLTLLLLISAMFINHIHLMT
mmetsp:Transcript_27000/g.26063  ORF Transcript_27000/g.26063 Transcript_27000/m.26063 type:complete len:121 (+) Transcript_27000:580-942(+)